MKNWIMSFIADERGAESTELSVTGIVVAGGAVAGFNTLKGKLDEKNGDLMLELDAATSDN